MFEHYNTARLLTFILCTVNVLAGCAQELGHRQVPHGRVVAGDTQEPVHGAFILARYVGDGPTNLIDPGAGVRNHCFGSLVTSSDREGIFNFSRNTPDRLASDRYTRNQRVLLTVYEPGYSYEYNQGKVAWLDHDLIQVRYDEALPGGNDFSLMPESASAYQSRYDYLTQLSGAFCDQDHELTAQHRAMLLAMKDDLESNARTSRDWDFAFFLCQSADAISPGVGRQAETHDCDPIKKIVSETAIREFASLQKIVDEIDWDQDGYALELIDYQIVPNNAGQSTFLVPNAERGLTASQLSGLIEKVCASAYPGDFNFGSACVYFGHAPDAPYTASSCHARVFQGRVSIRSGIGIGQSVNLEPGTCPIKRMPSYRWPKSASELQHEVK